MEKFFIVKQDSQLYKDYFSYLEDRKKVGAAFNELREEFGIETNEFYPYKDRMVIVPTENDCEKFEKLMKKTSFGEFKKTSEPHKAWVEKVKDIEHMSGPRLLYYFPLLGNKWTERLFEHDGKVYCTINANADFETPDFVTEIKGSEFYKVIEEYEERMKCDEQY